MNAKIAGLFEIHLTVDIEDRSMAFLENYHRKFTQACEEAKCKTESLKLDSGNFPIQIMTVSWQKGSVDQAIHQMKTLKEFLSAKGFKIIREKIEADASNRGVPQTDEEAKHYLGSNYFEFHLSVEPTKAAKAPLEEISKRFSGYLASELFEADKRGKTRYITLRYYRIGLKTAESNLEQAIAILKESGYRVCGKVEMEYAIFDNNLEIDVGWAN
jgi:hypothetical protein